MDFGGVNFVSAADEPTRRALWAARHGLYSRRRPGHPQRMRTSRHRTEEEEAPNEGSDSDDVNDEYSESADPHKETTDQFNFSTLKEMWNEGKLEEVGRREIALRNVHKGEDRRLGVLHR